MNVKYDGRSSVAVYAALQTQRIRKNDLLACQRVTKVLSMYDSNILQKSRGVVVNHAGLWIRVVAILLATERESPRLRFESARDYCGVVSS